MSYWYESPLKTSILTISIHSNAYLRFVVSWNGNAQNGSLQWMTLLPFCTKVCINTKCDLSIALLGANSTYFGEGTGPFLLHSVSCTGFESTLLECSHNLRASQLHSTAAGVQCLQSEYYTRCSVHNYHIHSIVYIGMAMVSAFSSYIRNFNLLSVSSLDFAAN